MPTSNKTEEYMAYFHRGKPSTNRKNARRLIMFCQWLKTNPQALVIEYEKATKNNKVKAWLREQQNRILGFYNAILENGKSINYARAQCAGVLSFHRQNTQRIEDITREFAPQQMATNEFAFTQDILRKMFYLADTQGKALISLAVCYAQHSKDFLSIEVEPMKRLIEEAKAKNIEFLMWYPKARAKTGVQPRSFLTPEAIESLDEYIKLLETKYNGKLPKYLWCNSKLDKHITNMGLNKKIKRYIAKANIETYGKSVHFGLFRKFFYTVVRNIDRDVAKVLTGKQTSISDMTYVQNLDEHLLTVFRVAYKHLSLNGDLTGQVRQKQSEQIDKLTNAIISLQKELASMKTREQTITQKLVDLEHGKDLFEFLQKTILSQLTPKQKKEYYELQKRKPKEENKNSS